MMNHDIEVEQTRSLTPVEATAPDSSLATAQFEAIIRAWKGEAVGQTVPSSPVGEVDWDGSLGLGELEADKFQMYIPVGTGSFFCSDLCTATCTTCTYTDPSLCQVA